MNDTPRWPKLSRGCFLSDSRPAPRVAVYDTVSGSSYAWLLHDAKSVWLKGRLYHESGDFSNLWRGEQRCMRVRLPVLTLTIVQLLAIWYVTQWAAQGASSKVRIVELGPGRGTLLTDILRVSPASLILNLLTHCTSRHRRLDRCRNTLRHRSAPFTSLRIRMRCVWSRRRNWSSLASEVCPPNGTRTSRRCHKVSFTAHFVSTTSC